VYNIIVRTKKEFLQALFKRIWNQIRRSQYDVNEALSYEE